MERAGPTQTDSIHAEKLVRTRTFRGHTLQTPRSNKGETHTHTHTHHNKPRPTTPRTINAARLSLCSMVFAVRSATSTLPCASFFTVTMW
jgi:hypothetical protein